MLKSSVSLEEDERAVVRLEGELDCSTTDELMHIVHSVLSNRPRRVVIDLAGVSFMDSSGLRCLLHAAEQASSRDAQLVVEGASGIVHRVLEVTGTGDALTGGVGNEEMPGQSVAS